PIGSLSAASRNVGALPAGALFRSPPIGTPLAYPAAAGLRDSVSDFWKSHPPKKRTTIRVPVVEYVSRRCIASQIASRVFSSAHTAAKPDELTSQSMMVAPLFAL